MGRFLHSILAAIATVAALAVAPGTRAEPQPQAAPKPRTIALLAAMGSQFRVYHEEQSTGSRISPYRHRSHEIAGNFLNKVMLNGLDKAIARIEPESRRIYLSASPTLGRGIEPVVAHLANMDRTQWDRIVVVTPAYRLRSDDGLPTHLEGLGAFWQVLCQSDPQSCALGLRPVNGPKATTPEGDVIPANTFIAPYTFIDLWVLDPKTLAVLERTTNHGHRKLADVAGSASGVLVGENKGLFARHFLEQVEASASEAVEANAALRGSVEVREKGPVK